MDEKINKIYIEIVKLRKEGKNEDADKLKIKLKKIQDENLKEYWLNNLKPFVDEYDVPHLPKPLEQYQINKLIECGAIPKNKLEINRYYLGHCRNASVAMWDGNVFWYMRTKFAHIFAEDINHFEDDNGFDLFVPIREVEPKEGQIIK